MIVVYELFKNDRNLDDERNIGNFDTLKETKMFLEDKFDTITSLANLSKSIKKKSIINKKYRIYKMNF